MRGALVLALALSALTVGRMDAQRSKTIALTFDDLPKAHGYDDVDGLRKTTDSILQVVKAHHAPVVAFVNEQQLYQGYQAQADRVDELRKWANAGAVLGNHTYSHIDLDNVSLQQYENDIIKGERVWPRLMRGHSTEKWFRHPFTHTGPTAEIKADLSKFLVARGYRVAPFTIENSDWIFSAAYVKAHANGDEVLARRVRDEYLSYNSRMFEWFESLARDDFGHDIPQILLIHSNDINSDALNALLTEIEKRGYRFVTLTEAMKDPAYAAPEEYVGTAGPSWLHRWRVAKQMPWRMDDEPDPPKWVVDLSK